MSYGKLCISGPLLGETTPTGTLPSSDSGTLPSVSSPKRGETATNMYGEHTFELQSATSLAPRSVHFNDFREDCEFLQVAGVDEGVLFAVGEIFPNSIESEFQAVGEAIFFCEYRLLVWSSTVLGLLATNQSILRCATWSSNDLCHTCKSFLASR